MEFIKIKGAREHNLKNIDLDFPRDKMVVFTGISGSGKSSLAYDTIFAEAQRRYLESLSSYARQFLGQWRKPDVDSIEGLSPAISIDQKTVSHNPRSTVGTVTEIYDYLRLLFARLGTPHCPKCGRLIAGLSQEEILEKILELPEALEIEIMAPLIHAQKGHHALLLDDLFKKGFKTVRIDKEFFELEEKISLDRYQAHNIDLVVDALKVESSNFQRVVEAVESALKLGQGEVIIRNTRTNSEEFFNKHLACAHCGLFFPEIEPHTFSFNSPYGACPECHGLGERKALSLNLIMPDKSLTIAGGGILPWSYKRHNYYGALLSALASYYSFSVNTRLKDINDSKLEGMLYGEGHSIPLLLVIGHGLRRETFRLKFPGLMPWLKKRYEKTESEAVRREIEKYMTEARCSLCGGARLKPQALAVKIKDKNIYALTTLSVAKALVFFTSLTFLKGQELVARPILNEIKNRLSFLCNVGLNYLTLERSAATLAGGESQRIRLASQLGSSLTGVLYILDEPSIGLHPRDNQQLLNTLLELKDQGNSLLLIEHDEETMRVADWLVDIGPGAGEKGGQIVAVGTASDLENNPQSLTGQYLSGRKKIVLPETRRLIGKHHKYLSVIGAEEHNLKNLTVDFPLGVLTCVTGVSGSGKSTLVNDVLYRALARDFHRSLDKPGIHKEIKGASLLNKVIEIDQSPIGRTPRSNPATYTGAFTPIRKLFALTPEARARGYRLGRFSFNVSGGRCDYCQGDGFIKVEMQFLPDVFVPCDYCVGRRYNQETLEIEYRHKNIAEVLEMTVSEADVFFNSIPEVKNKLKTLCEVGLGYIRLGQSATTLSGGEAQRIKLAKELSRLATGSTLYILDEPTTGLHFEDINKLLEVLQKLVCAGNTVVVIEHNLEVIKCADYIIDLGPEGGEGGGRLVAQGTPEQVSQDPKSHTGRFLKKVLGIRASKD